MKYKKKIPNIDYFLSRERCVCANKNAGRKIQVKKKEIQNETFKMPLVWTA